MNKILKIILLILVIFLLLNYSCKKIKEHFAKNKISKKKCKKLGRKFKKGKCIKKKKKSKKKKKKKKKKSKKKKTKKKKTKKKKTKKKKTKKNKTKKKKIVDCPSIKKKYDDWGCKYYSIYRSKEDCFLEKDINDDEELKEHKKWCNKCSNLILKNNVCNKKNNPICPDGSEAKCLDVDMDCFNGTDSWHCNGYFYCSNDKNTAEKKNGILCSEIPKKAHLMQQRWKKLDTENCGSKDGNKWTGKCDSYTHKQGNGKYTKNKLVNKKLVKEYELNGNFVDDNIKDGKIIVYNIKNGKSIKYYEDIGKFIYGKLNDKKGERIWYKMENDNLVKEFKEIGKFKNDNFKNGQRIYYKKVNGEYLNEYIYDGKFDDNGKNIVKGTYTSYNIINNKAVINSIYKGNFININDLEGENEKYIQYNNGKLEIIMEGEFKNDKLIKGKITFYKIVGKKPVKKNELIGNFINDKLNDENGKRIHYKIINNEPVKDHEIIGNFVNNLLNDDNATKIIFKDNGKTETYKEVYKQDKLYDSKPIVCLHKSGDKWTGKCINGMKQGEGTYTGYMIKDKRRFKEFELTGNFKNNNLNGNGTQIGYKLMNDKSFKDHKITGKFVNGQFNGNGKGHLFYYKNKNGNLVKDYEYIGNLIDNKKHDGDAKLIVYKDNGEKKTYRAVYKIDRQISKEIIN